MSTALQRAWTRDEFLHWAERQERRYEFDGSEPVLMVGGLVNHNLIWGRFFTILSNALDGTAWHVLGQDTGITTTGNRIRVPDVVLALGPLDGKARLIPDPFAVVEVVSPGSGRTDRVQKVREYAAVPSIRYYVIAESEADVLQVLSRPDAAAPWTITPLTRDDLFELILPDAPPLSIPVTSFYAGIGFEPETED